MPGGYTQVIYPNQILGYSLTQDIQLFWWWGVKALQSVGIVERPGKSLALENERCEPHYTQNLAGRQHVRVVTKLTLRVGRDNTAISPGLSL